MQPLTTFRSDESVGRNGEAPHGSGDLGLYAADGNGARGTMETSGCYRFGEFEFRARSLELFRGGERLRLQQQPARILLLLLDHSGEVVERRTIVETIWGDGTFIDGDSSLNFAVRHIRSLLGDDAEQQRYIQTLPRVGYRFAGDLEPVAESTVAAVATAGEGEAEPPETTANRLGWVPRLAFGLVLLVLLASLIGYLASGGRSITTGEVPTLLVRPLSGLHETVDDPVLRLGLTEELITQLARAHGSNLRLIGAATSGALGGEVDAAPAPPVAFDYALTGSAMRVGEQVRASLKLFDRDQELMWAESYEGSSRKLLAWQRWVATDIARTIGVRLAPAARARELPVLATGVFEDYLEGRYLVSLGRPLPASAPESFRRGIVLLQEVTQAAPDFAPARAALARAALRGAALLGPAAAAQLAEASAREAIRLDPGTADPWVSLSLVKLYHDRSLDEARHHLSRALALDAESARGRHANGSLLAAEGRLPEALLEIQQARALDPEEFALAADQAFFLFLARRHASAARAAREASRLAPRDVSTMWLGIRAAMQTGDSAAALAQANAFLAAFETPPVASLEDFWALHRRRLEGLAAGGKSPVFELALVALQDGHLRQGLDLLQRACQEAGNWQLVFARFDPRLDPIRGEPGYRELLSCLGLPKAPERSAS
ncbi:MAG: winged helix-turn-helix domain-containing protein [Acidobacteriota bacterium]